MKRSIMIALIGLLISFNGVQVTAGICPTCQSIEARKVKLVEDLHCAKPYVLKIAMDFTYITAFCLFFLHHARSGDKFLSFKTVLLATAYALGALVVKNSLKCFVNNNSVNGSMNQQPSCVHAQEAVSQDASVNNIPEESVQVPAGEPVEHVEQVQVTEQVSENVSVSADAPAQESCAHCGAEEASSVTPEAIDIPVVA